MARLFLSMPSLPVNRRESPSLCISGYLLLALGAVTAPCMVFAYFEGDPLGVTGIPMLVGLLAGLMLLFTFRMTDSIRPVNAVSMLGVLWAVCILYGTLPYIIYGYSPLNALFESASGFTTAGATMIPDVTVLPRSLLLWRQLTNWFGGIMVILLFMLLLPMMGAGSRRAISNEMSGSSGSRSMTVKVKNAALQFTVIYVLLTVSMLVLISICGLGPYDAVCLTLSTVSIGGFSCLVTSLTDPMKVVVMIFMFLGATNFYLHFRALFLKKPDSYRKDTEFVTMAVLMAAASVLMYLIVRNEAEGSPEDILLDSVFMTVSASSTAAIFTVDLVSWPPLAQLLIFTLAIIGASSGSSSGGIKVFRLVVLYQYIKGMFFGILHPNNVRTTVHGHSHASEDEVRSVLVVIMMFILTIVAFTIVFMAFGYDTVESVTSVTSALTSFGVGMGQFASNFQMLDPVLKVVMVLLMWMGRLEIITAIAILSPGTWKEQIKDLRHRRRVAAQ